MGTIGKKIRTVKVEMVGDFSVIVNPYLRKLLKNDDDKTLPKML